MIIESALILKVFLRGRICSESCYHSRNISYNSDQGTWWEYVRRGRLAAMFRGVPAARAARGKLPINVVGCLCRNRKEDGLV